MSQEVVILVLGVTFLVVVLALGFYAIRTGNMNLAAVMSFLGFKVELKLDAKKKLDASKHLEEAMQKKGEGRGLGEAEMPLETTQALKIRKVLWVDDHPSNNIVEVSMLDDLGLKVTQVEDTERALDLLKGEDYDALISDMTRGSDREAGFGLVNKMRMAGYNQPVVIYAGNADQSRLERATSLGVSFTTRPDRLLKEVLEVGQTTTSPT